MFNLLKLIFCKLYIILFIGPKYLIKEQLLERHRSRKFADFKYKKTIVITGGSKGVGLGAVKVLLKLNCHIIIGCRDVEYAGKTLQGCANSDEMKKVKIFPLNLASHNSVKEFANKVRDLNVPVDILINNAGIMKSCSRQETGDGEEIHFGVNYLGHVMLTDLLHPLIMRAAAAHTGESARIVNVSSATHSLCALMDGLQDVEMRDFYCPELAYSNSKTALIVFSQMLHNKFAQAGVNIEVLSVHPGVVFTELAVNSQETSRITQALSKSMFKTADQAGETLVHAAVQQFESSKLNKMYLESCKLVDVGKYPLNPVTQQNLWTTTKNKLNVSKICDFS